MSARINKKIKHGETVMVISGSHSGKQGKILQVLPSKNRAIVEGVAMMKKHQRKTQDNPEGSIVEREASIDISNLMLLSRYQERQRKRGVAVTPEAAPEPASEAAPESAAETAPETAPEAAPETTPEAAPETTSEAPPESSEEKS